MDYGVVHILAGSMQTGTANADVRDSEIQLSVLVGHFRNYDMSTGCEHYFEKLLCFGIR